MPRVPHRMEKEAPTMLINDYYTIEGTATHEGAHLYHIRLNPECQVYQGHFPGEPVSPGVCNIQMLKELAEQTIGRRLFMSNLNLCRLTTLVTPQEHPTMTATLIIDEKDGAYKLRATLGNGETTYLEMKAELA